jgi:hypothetical protein
VAAGAIRMLLRLLAPFIRISLAEEVWEQTGGHGPSSSNPGRSWTRTLLSEQ